jgi:16S rRNA (guanine527-N7)-methyltransferase
VPDADPGDPDQAVLHAILVEAREAGFLGPGDIAPHLLHAEAFLAVARAQTPDDGTARLLDLGSGAGLPGLVVATRWADAELVLLDANRRRADFLLRAVARCGLEGRVTVVQGRAEVWGRDPLYRGTFAGVMARSFGPPAVVAECGSPFLRPGGWMIVSEPPEAPNVDSQPKPEQRWPPEGLAQLGLEPDEVVRGAFGFQVLRQREACPERFARRDGVPAKKPLF